MYISYEQFIKKLEEKIKIEDTEYKKLIENIIKYPERYTGEFRLTNSKTKLIQNLTQSQEIRFGDFLVNIIENYFLINKYNKLEKRIINNKEILFIDHLFEKNNQIFMIEQKIRDDHDSTKKRGQLDNLFKKYDSISKIYKDKTIYVFMWFLDASLRKNNKYYQNQIDIFKKENNNIYLFYGNELFNFLKMQKMWDELLNHLKRYKNEKDNEVIYIPDFDKSTEILKQLIVLKEKLWNKLISSDEKYKNLRKEFFPNNINISKAKKLRNQKEKNDRCK
ncbi:HpyAIV family type II restriction enzyme [Mycoplasma sp. 1018B]|uniref:HpyAIV family type II restriction enzyme n=1 Tax=Mycoplasma sp. 1018B TaxID=2967302 RepID=UPI00211B9804|nr:hypothetical protein [Mycoplasma sp. 1018B]UUM19320.1 hypothetical protein NPA14_00370 [Mycoplasma sp. 1018B]